MMGPMQKKACAIVAVYLLLNGAHGLSHLGAAVPLEPWQIAFVAVVIVLLPIVAAVLYGTRHIGVAAWTLMTSLAAGLVFGVCYHFIADTVDHVSHRHADGEGIVFVITAVLLIPAALAGMVFAWWSWRSLRLRHQSEPGDRRRLLGVRRP
jgi:hypothetical protein